MCTSEYFRAHRALMHERTFAVMGFACDVRVHHQTAMTTTTLTHFKLYHRLYTFSTLSYTCACGYVCGCKSSKAGDVRQMGGIGMGVPLVLHVRLYDYFTRMCGFIQDIVS